jgi:hypothetical protein
MSRYTDNQSQPGDWLMTTARRNPEALLLLAAGCALLMRSGGSSSRRSGVGYRDEDWQNHRSSQGGSAGSNIRQGLSDTADRVADYASEMKDRVSETADSYAETMSGYAKDAQRTVSEQTDRLRRQAQSTIQDSMNRVVREQPLAIAVAGLAAGAAIAAAFPSTDIENRTLSGAREALTEAANKAGETVMGAASKAGERLKSAAAEKGLTSEGLKELATDVADAFTSQVAGKDKAVNSAGTQPDREGRSASFEGGNANRFGRGT